MARQRAEDVGEDADWRDGLEHLVEVVVERRAGGGAILGKEVRRDLIAAGDALAAIDEELMKMRRWGDEETRRRGAGELLLAT